MEAVGTTAHPAEGQAVVPAREHAALACILYALPGQCGALVGACGCSTRTGTEARTLHSDAAAHGGP
eukprot:365917-Chlamydomonas_euryale.AAC.24